MESLAHITEEWCLAALANNPKLFGTFWDRLNPELWQRPRFRTLLTSLKNAWVQEGDEIDILNLCRSLDAEAYTTLSGASLMSQDFQRCPKFVFESQIEQLENALIMSSARGIGAKIASLPEDPNSSSMSELQTLSSKLADTIQPPKANEHTVSLARSFNGVLQWLVDVEEGKPRARGIQTRIPTLNKLTSGLLPKKLWLITGETSDGKSMLAQNFAKAFLDAGIPSAIYSWEMPDEDITRRLLADHLTIPLDVLKGEVVGTKQQQMDFVSSQRWARENNQLLSIVNASAMDFLDLEADIRIKHIREGVRCIIVDYLQLVDMSMLAKDTHEQVKQGCTRLYRLAGALGITLIVLSQLNDDGKILSSRSPGHDCDVHIKIKKVLKNGESDESRRDLFLEKNRGGVRFKTIPCVFQGDFARFVEMDARAHDEERRALDGQSPQRRSMFQKKRPFSS